MDRFHVSVLDQKLSPLTKVLEEWIKCTLEYITVWGGDDLPYWYNERANVSILAGAAWRAGMTAIEEYQTEKEYINNEKSNGRNDLYISDKESGFAIEAKAVFPDIKKYEFEVTNKVINSARDDAKKLREAGIRLAAVFIAPHSKPEKASEEDVSVFLSRLPILKPDAYAWCVPKNAQNSKTTRDTYQPVVAILLYRI